MSELSDEEVWRAMRIALQQSRQERDALAAQVARVVEAFNACVWDQDDEEGYNYCDHIAFHKLLDAVENLRPVGPIWLDKRDRRVTIAAMEKARDLMCNECRDQVPVISKSFGVVLHSPCTSRPTERWCTATPIRAAIAAEKEKA